jgi:integrase
MAITVKELEALKPEQHGQRIADGESTYIRVHCSKDGKVSASFTWRYKHDNKVYELPLGTWPNTNVTELRSNRDKLQAEKRAAKLEAKPLPIEQREITKLKRQAVAIEQINEQKARLYELTKADARVTVREFFDTWRAKELHSIADGGNEVLRAFNKDVFPVIGALALGDVTKHHIQTIIDNMAARGIVRMTKRVFSDMRQMFRYAFDRDYIQGEPTAKIKKKAIGKDNERDRVLSEAEIIDLLRILPMAKLPETSRLALLIQLSCLTRIGEVLSAKWQNINLEAGTWLLPETKNGKAHTIYLSEYAIARFTELKAITGLCDWCLPNRRLDGPIDSKTVTKQVKERQNTGTPLQNRTKAAKALILSGGPWQTHDLRRTGATEMAGSLDIASDVIERCLNHTEENKIKRTYQHAKLVRPMTEAWRLWGERLELLTSKANGSANNVEILKATAPPSSQSFKVQRSVS